LSSTALKILKSGYVRGNTVFHRLDGRTKFLFFLWISIFNYIFYDLYFSLASLAIVLTLALASRIGKIVLSVISIVAVPILILGIIILGGPVGFPPNKTPLIATIVFGHQIGLFLEGTVYVSIWSTRLAVTITAALLAYLTTHPSDLAAIMLKSRLPYKFAYAFLATVQLIPILTNEISTIYQAQVSRGLNLQANLIQRLKSIVVLMIPLTLGAITQTQTRAIALESRGFSAPVKKVMLSDPKFKIGDYLMFFAMIVFTAYFVFLIYTRGLVPFMQGIEYLRPGG
jgi:energy-coupling factor transport system permease protein